jgi:hypothetical protein
MERRTDRQGQDGAPLLRPATSTPDIGALNSLDEVARIRARLDLQRGSLARARLRGDAHLVRCCEHWIGIIERELEAAIAATSDGSAP